MKIDDLFSVAGKTVLVTGGSRGIGEMIAAGFLANGAEVAISSRKADVCDATAARLAAEYGAGAPRCPPTSRRWTAPTTSPVASARPGTTSTCS